MGYAMLNFLIARDPERLRDVLKVVLWVGAMASMIFVGNILMGRIPVRFLWNAGFLAAQILAILVLFPGKIKT